VGNDRGQLLAQGTARVGKHFDIARIPVIKQQAISAYDPRVVEVTGISMMVTAQGADHTTGNAPTFKCDDKTVEVIAAESYKMQVNSAVADSIGLCVFGRSVTDGNLKLIADAMNDAFDLDVSPEEVRDLGREALQLEDKFNKEAGFKEEHDELPSFFHSEELPPTNRSARLHAGEVNQYMRRLRAGEVEVEFA